MKAADLIALLKDARGSLHGANHKLVERLDSAVAELESAQTKAAAKPAPQPPVPLSIPRRDLQTK